ncbi:hypothetical protein [Polaribacter sp. Hel1_85]|uniref:hypothetical protein n=1 Tax=Polaribacter sp. Hel1_85 TaxID=1250005 RepID=UPI00052B70D9|nr:hypothetical protein [Polaribacter sp. Hel1_85]KGL64043.1 hypothetical protein PHEL85_1085 [Polaribacter sp. Hel1_85]
MKRKIISILKQKENIYIFFLFLLFFPLKTQLQNVIILLFDITFRNGVTTEVFTYNYTGTIVGCEKVTQMLQLKPNMNWFQKHGVYFIKFLPSLFAFIFLFKRWKKDKTFKLFDWFLIIICCFSILSSINDAYFLVLQGEDYNLSRVLRLLPTIIIYLSIGIFIFLKVFTLKERLQTLIFGVLGFYGSFYLWMQYFGPIILPIAS